MKSPISPGQNSSGVKAANVVAVAAIIGPATSPVAFFAANFPIPPIFQESVNILDNDDGVIDKHPKGKNQAEQHNHVHRNAQDIEHHERKKH
ncbi:MAG: hypothetical protein CM1200mP14_08380 [Gammaproteobacteria bacterium]|nr:MAG: hypothetical protein CM1200mP14_08380 [Gammaproteobacteria bacterium]